MDIVDFKQMLWDYSRKISEQMNIVVNPICERHDITMIQTRILVELYEHQSHTIGSLANSIHMAGTNISTMCKKLANKGFVERVRDRQDERVVKVVLTEKGMEVVQAIDKELIDKIQQYIKLEGEESLESIIHGLIKLNELLIKMDQIDIKN